MSQDIEVSISGEISAGRLIRVVKEELSNLIGEFPGCIVSINELYEGKHLCVDNDHKIGEDFNRAYLLKLNKSDAAVGLYLSKIPDKYAEPDYVSIVVGASRDPLEYCLAAAIAISLAKFFDSEITDGNCFWVNKEDVTPQFFLSKLSVSGMGLGLEESAQKCFELMNKSE